MGNRVGSGGSLDSSAGSSAAKLTDILPPKVWEIIFADFHLVPTIKLTMSSKMFMEGWAFFQHMEPARYQLSAHRMNHYLLKRILHYQPNSALRYLGLYSGISPKKCVIDPKVLKLLPQFVGLRTLAFGDRTSGLAFLKDEAFSTVASLTQLTALDISWCLNMTEKGFGFIRALTNLQSLTMRGQQLLEYTLAELNTTQLTSLDINFTSRFSQSCVRAVTAHASTLTRLDLGKIAIHAQEFNTLDMKLFTRLTWLNFEESFFLQDKTLKEVMTLTKLQYLHLRDISRVTIPYALTHRSLAKVSRLTNLRLLSLEACPAVGDPSLAPIGKLYGLRYLNLRCCKAVTDEGLAHLSALTALQILMISRCDIRHGLAHLTGLQQLRHLQLMNLPNLEDDDLRPLAGLRKLRDVYLIHNPKITLQVKEHLRYARRLQHNIGDVVPAGDRAGTPSPGPDRPKDEAAATAGVSKLSNSTNSIAAESASEEPVSPRRKRTKSTSRPHPPASGESPPVKLSRKHPAKSERNDDVVANIIAEKEDQEESSDVQKSSENSPHTSPPTKSLRKKMERNKSADPVLDKKNSVSPGFSASSDDLAALDAPTTKKAEPSDRATKRMDSKSKLTRSISELPAGT